MKFSMIITRFEQRPVARPDGQQRPVSGRASGERRGSEERQGGPIDERPMNDEHPMSGLGERTITRSERPNKTLEQEARTGRPIRTR